MKIFNKKLLAVEVAGGHIRAAVVTKKGKGFEILDFSQVDRPDPEDDLPAIEAIRTLATRMDYTSGPAIYVTSLARAVEISMNRKKILGMKHYQLMEAVKWEVEPYTGVTGMQAIVGVEKKEKAAAEPGMVSEPEETDVTVNVSVLEKNIYRAIKERFKVAGTLFAWSSFDLDMEGSFSFFLEFLTALREMSDSVKIQNINIEKNGDVDDVLKINMTLMI